MKWYPRSAVSSNEYRSGSCIDHNLERLIEFEYAESLRNRWKIKACNALLGLTS